MDYKTKATSRICLRRFSVVLRELFDVPLTGAFPVLEALDKLCDVFEECNYEIVEDDKMSPQTMARCMPNERGGFTIEIKEAVYNGAYNNQNGALLGFICHEICHVFLFKVGFVPLFERSFEDNELPAFCSVEWQAKALCAELMIPFNESKNLSIPDIIQKYRVSKAFAKYRNKLETKS